MTFYIEGSQLLLKDSDRLDYEKQTQITIHVRTTDSGPPQMFTQVQWNSTNIAVATKYFNTKLWNQNLSHIIQGVISLKKKRKLSRNLSRVSDLFFKSAFLLAAQQKYCETSCKRGVTL